MSIKVDLEACRREKSLVPVGNRTKASRLSSYLLRYPGSLIDNIQITDGVECRAELQK
jgi:hypothetical protein